MKRIDTDTKDEDLFGSGKHGFTGGDPGMSIAPTDLSPGWCNAVQEELANAIEGAGVELDPENDEQLTGILGGHVGNKVSALETAVASRLIVPVSNAAIVSSEWSYSGAAGGQRQYWQSAGEGASAFGWLLLPLQVPPGVAIEGVGVLVSGASSDEEPVEEFRFGVYRIAINSASASWDQVHQSTLQGPPGSSSAETSAIDPEHTVSADHQYAVSFRPPFGGGHSSAYRVYACWLDLLPSHAV